MSEHEQRPKDEEQAGREETIEDLETPQDQAQDVAGGVAGVPVDEFRSSPDE